MQRHLGEDGVRRIRHVHDEAMFVLHLSEMATINGLIRIAYIPNTDKIVQMQEKLESYLDLTKNEPTK